MGNSTIKRHGKDKKVIRGLDNTFVLTQLLDIAEQLNISVRQEKGDFTGGSCRVEQDRLIFLKKTDPDSEKITILTRELIKFDSDNITIDSAIRDYMNRMREEYKAAVQEEVT